jgi:hypothetical protein
MAKFLVKANDQLVSHCTCTAPLASCSSQLDCPWCGCGWLICCQECGKAFTFAKVIQTDLTYEQIIRRDFSKRGYDVGDSEVADLAIWLAEAMAPFELDDIVIYLDGAYFGIDERDIEFTGLFAEHSLNHLPHAEALKDSAVLGEVLGEASYWFDRERPDRSGDD